MKTLWLTDYRKWPSSLQCTRQLQQDSSQGYFFAIRGTYTGSRDPRFASASWGSFCARLGIKRLLSRSAHPQTDGRTERTIRTQSQVLRGYVGDNTEDWAACLPIVEFAYNSAVHESTGAIPISLIYITPPDEFPELPEGERSNSNDVSEEASRRLTSAKANPANAQAAQKRAYAPAHRYEVFQAGDLVFVSTRLMRVQGRGESKLGPRWTGPCAVLKRVSDLPYIVYFPSWMRTYGECWVSAQVPGFGTLSARPA